jgi:hypothetical protein
MNELITRSLASQSTTFLLRIPDPMLNDVERRWVRWIRDYIVEYGVTPTLERFVNAHPHFIPLANDDPLADVFDRTLVMKKNALFIETINENQKALRDGADPTEIVHRLEKLFSVATGTIFSSKTHNRLSYLEPHPTFSYNLEVLDTATGGIAAGDYVLVAGRPGSYKTTFVEGLIANWAKEGQRILYISNENPPESVLLKLDAFWGGFNPLKMRTGDWTKGDNEKLRTVQELSASMDGEVIIPSFPAFTIEEIVSHINMHNPQILFVDGVYLMHNGSNGGWEEIAAISRSLKRLARERNLPILGTIQANRRAEGNFVERDTIAATDAFLQDADCVITLNRVNGHTVLQILKNRWGPMLLSKSHEVVIDFDTMTINVLAGAPVQTIREEDW